MDPDLNRRDFLSVCSVLAASLVACSNLTDLTREAALFVADPALTDYRATLRGLIETILPREFPLEAPAVEERLLRMFPLEDERRFLGLQRTLLYFRRLDLVPHVAAPLLALERVALDVPARMDEGEFRQLCSRKIEIERKAFAPVVDSTGRTSSFDALSRDVRLQYLRLWSTSEFTIKREFAHTLRKLVNVAAYSSDRVWPAIGYEGTLLGKPERS